MSTEKAEEVLRLRILSNYKLEFGKEKNRFLYLFCTYLSPIMRIVAVVLIFPSVFVSLYFLIGIAFCLVVSIIMDNAVKNTVFTLIYEWKNGIFSVRSVNLAGKVKIMEIFDCKNIDGIKRIDRLPESANDRTMGNKFYFKENPITEIKIESKSVYITPDKYLLALLEERGNYGIL